MATSDQIFAIEDEARLGPIDCADVNTALVDANSTPTNGFALIYNSTTGKMTFEDNFITGDTQQTLTGNWTLTGTTVFQPGTHTITRLDVGQIGPFGPIAAGASVNVPLMYNTAFPTAPRLFAKIVSDTAADNNIVTTVEGNTAAMASIRVTNRGGAATSAALQLSVLSVI